MAAPLAPEALLLDRYRIEEVVGRGSFGRVLRVVDRAGALRALKVVPRGPHEGMLLEEFEQLARLRHPCLPRVYEVGRTREPIEDIAAGAPFFLADWIAGARSDAVAWTGDLGTRVWSLLADVAGALATIHAAGLVHGDVAPQNLLVEVERTVLVDLGLATGSGARGTPAYMAPEALAGLVEPRSDLYGLGATLVRLVTGRPPFEGKHLGELAQRILAGTTLRTLPGVPPALVDLIGRMLARDVDRRPGSALAVLDELDQLAPAIAPGSGRRARPKVGPPPAPGSWPGAEPVIDAIARSLEGASATVVVVGSPATGSRQLVDRAIQRWQLAQVVQQRPAASLAGSLEDVATTLALPPSSTPGTPRSWLERVARAARRARELVLDRARG